MKLKSIKRITKPLIDNPIEETKKYANLREVMDYSRDLTMFYSGVEYEVYLDGCYDMGIRNFLMSYEYLKSKGAGAIKKYPDMHLFIDSGAFTYMNDPKYNEYTVEMWEEQIERYLNWARKHKDSIFGMAELDLQHLVGLDTVTKWRREYFEPFMLETGIPVCFIYHNEGMDLWEKMCERYPYVGFSSVADTGKTRDLDSYREMLRYAQKYNSLVHGFGMTRTSMLPELPFYTVDSTSWKGGFRYGLLSIWNGKKVQQFKRDEWENRVMPVIRNYPDIKFDEDLLNAYNEPEVLRVNVYAYMRAEEYIAERLKSLTYWKKSKAVMLDLDNLPDDFFPDLDWFRGPKTDFKDYCLKMNINPEYEGATDLVADVTLFSNWNNPDYEPFRNTYLENDGAIINELHTLFLNTIVPDVEARVQDLIKFYTDCLSGKNDRLLQMGTNFDRFIKERDSYIEEESTELVDIKPEEVRERLKGLLPTPSDTENAPEIEELDEEIFKQVAIVPTYDENGKFVKGQVAVRKPKQVYSAKFPKFACDTCYGAMKCPEFKAGYVCAFHKMFSRFSTRDMGDIIESMQGIVEHNMTRMQRAMIMETLNGGIDNTVSALMDTNIKYMGMLKQMYENSSPEVLRRTTIVKADGSTEDTLQATNPQGGGILEKLFSMQSRPDQQEDDSEDVPRKKKKKETIDAEYEVVD